MGLESSITYHFRYLLLEIYIVRFVSKFLFKSEPHHEKSCFLHMQKQRCTLISCGVTAQPISTFVFATWIASTITLLPKSENFKPLAVQPKCVGPGWKPQRQVFCDTKCEGREHNYVGSDLFALMQAKYLLQRKVPYSMIEYLSNLQ